MTNNNIQRSPLAVIIEDDEKLSAIYAQAVRQAGFSTRTIMKGDEAILELKILHPWLVILDLHLPHVSGETILQAIRMDPRLSNTKVIITTADTIKAQILEDEGDLVLVKPVSFAQLRDMAQRLVQADLDR